MLGSPGSTLLGIIKTGIKWRILDNFAIFFSRTTFSPVVNIPANNYPELADLSGN